MASDDRVREPETASFIYLHVPSSLGPPLESQMVVDSSGDVSPARAVPAQQTPLTQ